jgi:hypothetical protein
MLLNVITLYIITICLCILVVEDKLQVYCFESSAQWWTSSNDEVGYLSYLVSIFVYLAYLRLELIYAVIFVCCGLLHAIERFSS